MDSTSELISIGLLIFLLICSSFFSASETALMSISKFKLRKMQEDEIKGVDVLLRVTEDDGKLLSTILVANNIANIGASSIATSLVTNWIGASGVAISTLCMTIFVVIFGELTPKSIASKYPEKVGIFVAKIILMIMHMLSPIVYIFNIIRILIFKILRIDMDTKEPLITEDEFKTLVNVSHEEGVLESEEKEIIHNVFEFGTMQAKDAMINRMNIVGVDLNINYNDLIDIFKEEQFSRMPVYEDSIDRIIGIVNIKDIAFLSESNTINFNMKDYMRDAYFTYEFKSVSELLEEMKNERVQMAIVLDEYGGTSGLITIENLIEEIVGDIEDEYDTEEDENIIELSEYEYLIDGSTSLSEVNDRLNVSLESSDCDSIGGFIIENIKGFPNQEDNLNINDIDFSIIDIEKNKINKIKITLSENI